MLPSPLLLLATIKYYPPATPMYWLLTLVHCGSLICYSMEIEEMYAHVRSSPLFSLVASSSMGALGAGAGASPDGAKNRLIEDECLRAAFAVLRALSSL